MLTVSIARARLGLPAFQSRPSATLDEQTRATVETIKREAAKKRRAEEQSIVASYASIHESERTLARIYRATNGQHGHPMSVKYTRLELRRLQEDDCHYREPRAAAYEQHITDLCRLGGVTAIFVSTPGAWTNGYAWRALKRAEGPVIRTAWTYATWLHEVAGHCLDPGTDCRGLVECEIQSWRAAQRVALEWTSDMHANLADALHTYAHRGTAAQQAEIREMTSAIGFHRAQLDRLRRDRSTP